MMLFAMAIQLDSRQQQLSDVASKYMMLFAMAMFSSVLTYSTLLYIVNLDSGLRHSFSAMDTTVSLYCIALQFTFATKHYNKVCAFCDRKCMDIGSQRTKRIIHRHISLKNINLESKTPESPPDHEVTESTNTCNSPSIADLGDGTTIVYNEAL